MRIAYLVNRYPTVSHTFIRREILGIEAEGHEVARFSIRAAPGDLPDAADIAERERTRVVLDQPLTTLLLAAAASLLRRPGATWRAIDARLPPASSQQTVSMLWSVGPDGRRHADARP